MVLVKPDTYLRRDLLAVFIFIKKVDYYGIENVRKEKKIKTTPKKKNASKKNAKATNPSAAAKTKKKSLKL